MRKRIIFYTLIALMIQFLILSGLFIYKYRYSVKESIKDTFKTTITIEQGIFESFLKEKISNVFLLSKRNGLIASLDEEIPLPVMNENLNTIIDSFMMSYEAFKELYLFDDNLKFIMSKGVKGDKEEFYTHFLLETIPSIENPNLPLLIEKKENNHIQFYIIAQINSFSKLKKKEKIVGFMVLKIKDSAIDKFFKIIESQLSKLNIPNINVNFETLINSNSNTNQRFCGKINRTILQNKMCLEAPINQYLNLIILKEMSLLLLISMVLIIFMIVFQINYMKKVFQPVFKTIDIFRAVSRDEKPNIEIDYEFEEFGAVKDELSEVLQKIEELQKSKDKEAAVNALVKQSKQIHHDLRNPIEGLFLTLKSIKDEDVRFAMFNSVQRIKDLIDVLKAETLGMQKTVEYSVHPFIDAVYSLTAQSRLLYSNRKSIKFELNTKSDDYDKFFKINYLELNRIITNVIKNSAEALSGVPSGKITVNAYSDKKQLKIECIDNGIGFDPHILSTIGTKEISSKTGGQGLGLKHAFNEIVKMDGKLTIESKKGEGTKVTLIFQHHLPPTWWCDTITLKDDMTIFALDDDDFLHEAADKIIASNSIKNPIFHFKDANEFTDFYFNNYYDTKNCLFLFDYELIGQDTNGINLAKDLSIIDSTILITSKANESYIQNKCLELNLKMIPKFIFNRIKILNS